MTKQYPVDLVYLWCDGSDPNFQERRNAALERANKKQDRQAIAEGRVVQIDELKYSLRSVEKYMPWIRHVFIVTDRQVPAWLNTENPKVTVVDQSEILPSSALPSFNSNAIETALYKIPNLAEHFLYANDDMFVNRKIEPSFFFTASGKIIIRAKHRPFHPNSLYDRQLEQAQEKILISFHKHYRFDPHHNIDPYLKSDFQACAEYFHEEFETTVHHTFRQQDSIQRLIVHLFSLVKKHAIIRKANASRIQRTFRSLHRPKISSVYIPNNRLFIALQRRLFRYKPALFCINDGENGTFEDRICTKKFLESYFPEKSSFEK